MLEELKSHQLAETLRGKNINVIPIQPYSKIPLDSWKKYQKERYLGPIPKNWNFACICGEISGNLLAIDIDKTQDKTIIDKILPNALNETLVVQTGGGGFHILVRCLNLPKSGKLDANGIHIDIQAEGKYIIGCGSIHPNRKRYDIISNTINIKVIDFQDILVNLEKLGFKIRKENAGLLASGGLKEGDRHGAAVKYANHLLFKVGVSYDTLKYEMKRWNETNNPPSPESEIERICDDSYNYFQKENAREQRNLTGKDPSEKTTDDYADEIMLLHHFKTLRDTEELLVYKNGIYLLDPECSVIKEECEKLVVECSTKRVNEIINKIKRRTYAARNDFDYNPNVLNLRNGLFDLENMKIEEHTPNYLSLTQLPINYNPEAVPFGFCQFIRQCLPNPENVYTVMEGFAYCLMRSAKFEKAFMFIGEGNNGKSTFLVIMQRLLGTDNVANASLHDLTYERFTKAELFGKLANIHPDIESNELKNTGILKALISGDWINAEKKHIHPFRFKNYAKLFFSANRFPEVLDQSEAFFRRFVIIDWFVSFRGREDRNLKDRLCDDPDELSGIFNILVRLVKNLNERGRFRYTNQVEELRKRWNEKANPVRKFIEEYIHFGGDDYWIIRTEAYTEYAKFCGENRVIKESPTIFYEQLVSLSNLVPTSRRINGESTHVFVGGCLKSKLRKPGQEKL